MARKAEQTRDRIDRTALRLFAAKGVDQTTINDIATGAGIAEGTIYRHYPSKDELIWQLFSGNYAALAERLDMLQAREGDPRDKLRVLIHAFCALFDADPDMFSFLLLAQHGQLPRVPEGMATPVKVVREVMVRAIERGATGFDDPDLATAVVFGMVLQPAVFKVYGRITRPMSDLAGELAAAAGRVLAGGAEAP